MKISHPKTAALFFAGLLSIQAAQAQPALEGAGVKLHRAFGFYGAREFDPFLLLDDFRNEDPNDYLHRTFQEVEDYDEMVTLRGIDFESHCEHHIAPIIGKAHVAYLPNNKVVGISKLARLIEVYGKRLQIQEKMTAQVANTLNSVLEPKGVAVVIDAAHECMTTRGVDKPGVNMVTSRMLGAFRNDAATRREFLAMIGNPLGNQ